MKKTSTEYQNDIAKYPIRYRSAVMNVFLSFIKSKEGESVGTPMKLIQEFSTYVNTPFVDLKDTYYKKVENIRAGKFSHPFDDMFLFPLIERFVWNYKADDISKLLLRRDIHELGNRLSEWHDVEENLLRETHTRNRVSPKTTEEGVVYKFCTNVKNMENEIEDIYLAIMPVESEAYRLCIVYSPLPPLNMLVGIYIENCSTAFLRNFSTHFPCTLSMSYYRHARSSRSVYKATSNYVLWGEKWRQSGTILTRSNSELLVETNDSIAINMANRMLSRYNDSLSQINI